MGYLICRNCNDYFELQEGESANDYDCCHCGGSLKHAESLDELDSIFSWIQGIRGEEVFDIIESDDEKISVIAGPGTGKTFTLKKRVQRLLSEGKDPSRMLVVTFSRTAASDIKKNLFDLDVEGIEKIVAKTLHSYCFSVLNKEGVLDSIERNTRTLFDFEKRFMLQDLSYLGCGNINPLKEKLKAFEAAWARLQSEEPGNASRDDIKFQESLYDWLEFHDAMIIEEIVKQTYDYLIGNPSSDELVKFDYIFVDEYQDLNKAEQRLLELLAEHGASVMIIGDDDQSIFETFRHAHPEGIYEYTQEHCSGEHKSLNKCRRCPEKVINVAQKFISYNRIRYFPKELEPVSEENKGNINLIQWPNLNEEVKGITQFIKMKIEDGSVDINKILVLSPSRHIGYMIRDKLDKEMGIKAISFFSEQELKRGSAADNEKNQHQKAFTLLTLLADPDDKVALRCWLGFGSQGLKAASYQNLIEYCYNENITPKNAIEMVINGDIEISRIEHIIRSYNDLNNHIENLGSLKGINLINEIFPENEPWSEPFRSILTDINDDSSAKEIYDELKTNIIQPELPTDVDYVRIMSLHKSKGLTADMVIICSSVDNLIPFRKRGLSRTEQQRRFEEQRRLFYVGITRTTNILVISSFRELPDGLAHKLMPGARLRRNRGNLRTIASPFIHQLGPDAPRSINGNQWISNISNKSNGD